MRKQNWAFFFMYEGVMTGGPKRTYDTALACRKYGMNPVLVSNQPSPILDQARSDGIAIKTINVPSALWQRQGKAISLNPFNVVRIVSDLKIVSKQIGEIIQNEEICGWWSRGVKNVLMARGAARRKKVPLVWDIGSEYRSRGLVAAIHYHAFNSCTKVVSQGRAVVEQTFPAWMLKRFADKICPIIPGLQNDRIGRLDSIFDQYDRKGPLCIVGTVNDRKNQVGLLEACNHLLSKGKRLKLKLVGDTPNEDYLARCKALTEQYPEHYIWSGWSSDVVETLRDCSALVMASKSEGLPQVVLEAMHSGRLVISVPVGAVPDLIQDGKNGLLAEEIQVGQLAQKIESYLDLPDSSVEWMRQSAKRTVQNLADHDRWQKEYAALLQSLGETS